MSHQPDPLANIAFAVEGALAWWREAGLTHDFSDEPRAWLAPQATDAQGMRPTESAIPTPPGSPALSGQENAEPARQLRPLGGKRENWPATLAEFREWWLSEPSLDDADHASLPPASRVPPRGPAGAQLMILVAEPETPDSDILLSGPQGRLLAAMLTAMGITAQDVYIASALPRRTPLADWAGLRARGLGEILAHHVALVAPLRLVSFGKHIPPLLGHDLAQSAAVLQFVNQGGATVPLLQELELAYLLDRPATKASFWQRWLDWTTVERTGPK